MKKTLAFFSIIAIIASVAVFANGSQETGKESITLKLAHSYETSTPYHKWAVWASDQIKEQTDGRITIEIFPSGILGTEREVEEALKLGTCDLGFVGPGHMAQSYEPISIHLAPFLWRDLDHFSRYPGSKTYKEVTSKYMEITGNHILALNYFGQRHVTSNKPLHIPADFKNLKMRVPPLPIYMIFPKAVGANTTPINFNELFIALQQGVCDAQENPLVAIKSNRFYEVQKYIILTGHMFDAFYTLCGDHVWNKLSESERGIFLEVFTAAAKGITEDVIAEEAELVDWFTEQGNIVIEVDRQLFIDACADKMTGADLPWTQEQIDEIKSL